MSVAPVTDAKKKTHMTFFMLVGTEKIYLIVIKINETSQIWKWSYPNVNMDTKLRLSMKLEL